MAGESRYLAIGEESDFGILAQPVLFLDYLSASLEAPTDSLIFYEGASSRANSIAISGPYIPSGDIELGVDPIAAIHFLKWALGRYGHTGTAVSPAVETTLDGAASAGVTVPAADFQEIVEARNTLGEVTRRFTVPIKTVSSSTVPAVLEDTGMSRCSLTYAPPITFAREGTWAKGTWQSTGPGGVGYYPVKLSKDARIVGTEFEWPQFPSGVPVPPPPPPLRENGVIMDSPVVSAPIDNGDGTFSKEWKLHIKYVERNLLSLPFLYDVRIEFDLLYTVTYDNGKTWSEANYCLANIQGPKNDCIIWGDYEAIEKADLSKEVWRTTVGSDGLANFPASASYPIRNQQTAWAILRQTDGAANERDRLRKYMA